MKKQIVYIFIAISIITSISYVIYTFLNTENIMENMLSIINSIILCIFCFVFSIIALKITKNKFNIYIPIASILLISFICINLLCDMGVIALQKKETVNNFVNQNISEVLKWANANDIKIKQIYEYSDSFPEFYIMSQNIKEGTSLDEVKTLELIISSGPDYEKTVIVPNMVGWNVDDVLKFVKDNYMINVEVAFEDSGEEKNVLINQDKNGALKRNEAIKLIFSLGDISTLEPTALIDFTNKSLLEAEIWLKSHGITYQLKYDFNEKIKRNYIIGQSINKDEIVNPNTDIGLVINVSKGKQIKVPDLLNMEMEDITKWVSDNNLKIKFSDRYDDKIKLGKIIEVNYKKDDIIEEGTLISIVTSKGQLRLPDLKSVYQYRDWAKENSVEIKELYEFNSSVPRGDIVKLSHNIDDVIVKDDIVTITISQGKPTTIPNFVGKSKSSASSLCSSSHLRCTYRYGSYSSVSKDTITYQSKRSGAQVIEGSSIVLTMSKGTAKVFDFVFYNSWVKPGDADGTISYLKKEFNSRYDDVKFIFVKKPVNSGQAAGYIHPDSPLKQGNKVTQGKTYYIWIIE